jgi:methionyl-tRNA formyltransferase
MTKNLKIGVFAYNFKHWKTQQGIQNLCLAGFKPEVIFAADPVELKFYKSKIRVGPKDLFLWHPKQLAEYHGIDFHVTVHNSRETANIVKEKQLDVGVILGARILKPIAFDQFKIGVINMHPGMLPQNRGLDNLKWGILEGHPQGVTSHIVDAKIDRGFKILQEKINIYDDDTLVDLQLRLQNLEQKLMIESLKCLQLKSTDQLEPLSQGRYYRSVPPEKESQLMESFEIYKKEMSKCQQ